MVRFHWHVEEECGAQIIPGDMAFYPGTSVQHATVEIEHPGQKDTTKALFTIPKGYLFDGETQTIGILVAHGEDSSCWDSDYMTRMSVKWAEAGYVVVRYHCEPHRELLRQRMFEKALDTVATSPFGRGVTRWVLLGWGSGARVAACVGARCRSPAGGYVLLSYPLKEGFTTAQGTRLADGSGPLVRLNAPALFVEAAGAPCCSAQALAPLLPAMDGAAEVLYLPVQGVGSSFCANGEQQLPEPVTEQLAKAVLDFCWVLGEEERQQRAAKKAAEAAQQQQQQQQVGVEGAASQQQQQQRTQGADAAAASDQAAAPMEVDGDTAAAAAAAPAPAEGAAADTAAAAGAGGAAGSSQLAAAEAAPNVVTTQWQQLKGPGMQLPAVSAGVAQAAAAAVAVLEEEDNVVYDVDPFAEDDKQQ